MIIFKCFIDENSELISFKMDYIEWKLKHYLIKVN